MLADPKCAPCVLNDVFAATEFISLTNDQQNEVVKQVIAMLNAEFTLQRVPSEYITAAHRILKRVSGLEDPFTKVRRLCNEVGQRIALRVRSQAQSIQDDYARFKFLVTWAITGNSMDIRTVGAGYSLTDDTLYNQLHHVFSQGLAVDDTQPLFNLVQKATRILYILDNVGEIAFDRVLIDEIKAGGIPVIAAVKGGPMTSDSTMRDAKFVGIDHSADDVIVTGPDTLGISFQEMSTAMRQEIEAADLTLGKGQANFYVLSEHRHLFPGNVACLFSTKCDVVTRLFSRKGKVNIAKLL